jgi:hypothetical protein
MSLHRKEPAPALYGSGFKARKGEFKVEFLTPLTGHAPAAGAQTEIRQLGVPAIPLRFLDYLIANPLAAIAVMWWWYREGSGTRVLGFRH